MITAAITELKARLSAFLEQIKAGHEVLITDRGMPVAKLVPLEGKQLRGSRRERLARVGLLRLGKGRVRKSLLSAPRGKLTGKSVLKALLEEREEGR